MQIATIHRMTNYVESYLEEGPLLLSNCRYSAFRDLEIAETSDQIMDSERNRFLTRKEAALHWSRYLVVKSYHSEWHAPLREDMLRLALKYHYCMADYHTLMVIQKTSIETVKALLKYPIPTRLSIPCSLLAREHRKLLYLFDENNGIVTYTLLGGFLHWSPGDTDRSSEVMDLLLARGEDINAVCSPLGTVLHNILDAMSFRYQNVIHRWESLMLKGANIDVSGPFGNLLEFIWKLANTAGISRLYKEVDDDFVLDHDLTNSRENVEGFRELLKYLLGKGLENKQLDPNGCIPTEQQMLAWGQNMQHFCDCRIYYREGASWPVVRDEPSSESMLERLDEYFAIDLDKLDALKAAEDWKNAASREDTDSSDDTDGSDDAE